MLSGDNPTPGDAAFAQITGIPEFITPGVMLNNVSIAFFDAGTIGYLPSPTDVYPLTLSFANETATSTGTLTLIPDGTGKALIAPTMFIEPGKYTITSVVEPIIILPLKERTFIVSTDLQILPSFTNLGVQVTGATTTLSYVVQYDRAIPDLTQIRIAVPSGGIVSISTTGSGGPFYSSTILTTTATATSGTFTVFAKIMSNTVGVYSTTVNLSTFLYSYTSLGSTSLTVQAQFVLPPALSITNAPPSDGCFSLGSVPVTQSSVASYSLTYSNITDHQLKITPSAHFGISTLSANGPFVTNSTIQITPPSPSGTIPLWIQFSASTITTASAQILHELVSGGLVSTLATLSVCASGAPYLAIFPPVYHFLNVTQQTSRSAVFEIKHQGLTQPFTVTTAPGFVVAVWSTTSYVAFTTTSLIIPNPYLEPTGARGFYGNFSEIFNTKLLISVIAVAPGACGAQTNISITSGIYSTTLSVQATCQPAVNVLCQDAGVQPNDPFFSGRLSFSGPIILYGEIDGSKTIKNARAQWHLCNPENPSISIQATKAWEITTGNPSSMIAIVGTSNFRLNHPDYGSKIKYPNTNSFNDEHDHESLMAGIAAAIGNNNTGIAGVDWHAKLAFFRGGNEEGYVAGLATSLAHPNTPEKYYLRVSNHSYSAMNLFFTNSSHRRRIYAQMYKQDILAVASMGNNSHPEEGGYADPYPRGVKHAPAAWSGVFAIGGTDQNDERYDDGSKNGSQAGEHIGVAAPSVNILSTGNENSTRKDPWLLVHRPNDFDYYSWSSFGTSNAAPVVSGIASLMFGYARANGRYLYRDDVENIIKLSADKVGSTAYTVLNNGLADCWNEHLGHGRVNAHRALVYLRDGTLIRDSSDRVGITKSPLIDNITTVATVPVFDMITTTTGMAQAIGTSLAGDTLHLRQHEIIQTVSFAPQVFSAPPRIWGRGAAMSATGLLDLEPYVYNETIHRYDHYGIGGLIVTAVTTTQATLKTFIYEELDGMGNPTGRWFPCKKEQVAFRYSLFVPPPGQTPCEIRQNNLALQRSPGADEMPLSKLAGVEGIEATDDVSLISLPNPLNETATLRYTIPASAFVKLQIYDAFGIAVSELFSGHRSAGHFEAAFNARHLASGVYHARLTVINDKGQTTIKSLRITIIK